MVSRGRRCARRRGGVGRAWNVRGMGRRVPGRLVGALDAATCRRCFASPHFTRPRGACVGVNAELETRTISGDFGYEFKEPRNQSSQTVSILWVCDGGTLCNSNGYLYENGMFAKMIWIHPSSVPIIAISYSHCCSVSICNRPLDTPGTHFPNATIRRSSLQLRWYCWQCIYRPGIVGREIAWMSTSHWC